MPYFTSESLKSMLPTRVPLDENMVTASVSEKSAQLSRQHVLPGPTAAPTVVFDIFLSHSSLDRKDVDLAFLALTAMGYVVYLDRVVDPLLTPFLVTKKTADVLRRRMAQSRSMFVATSANTSNSKWVPWELGFADGWRGKVAIMPILATPSSTFSGQEYFGLYPEVQPSTPNTRPMGPLIVEGSKKETWETWMRSPRQI